MHAFLKLAKVLQHAGTALSADAGAADTQINSAHWEFLLSAKMLVSFVFLVLFVLALSAHALKDLPERARGGALYQELLKKEQKLHHVLNKDGSDPATPLTWSARLDHFDASNTATFQQR